MVTPGVEPVDGDGDVAAVLREEVGVEHRVAAGVAPDAGRVGEGDGDFGVRAVRQLEILQLAVVNELHAGQELRLVVAVKIPEIVRRLTGRREARLRAVRADAKVDVEEGLGGEGKSEEEERSDGEQESSEDVASQDWPALTPALSPRRGGATGATATARLFAALVAQMNAARRVINKAILNALPLLGERAGVRVVHHPTDRMNDASGSVPLRSGGEPWADGFHGGGLG